MQKMANQERFDIWSFYHDPLRTSVMTNASMVHSLSSGKGKMFLCAACHALTAHVNAWKNLIGNVVQIQARG